MAELAYLSIADAHEALTKKRVSAVELTQYYLDRITKLDPKVRAVLTRCDDEALAAAALVDAKIAAGEEIGLLEGIPYTAKDMFLTKSIRTTAASKILDNFIPPFSATVIEKLDDAGAIMIAKVNQDEFAHGGSTENSGYHPTHNPWDSSRVPGGSSGGSAAAAAADFGIFSLGTDTGGSIRQPAAYCGVTGFKPTYGAVSRYGVVAMGSSFDCIGPIARSAEDAAIVMDVIAGRDAKDSTTIELKRSQFAQQLTKPLSGKKVGVITEYITHLEDPSRIVFDQANSELEQLGLEVVEVSLPTIEKALAAYYVLTPSEISSNLSRYDGIRYGHSAEKAHSLIEVYNQSRDEGFGGEVKRRVLTGTYALSAGYYDAYYKKAMQVRSMMREEFEKAFEKVDFLIGPSTPTPAFRLGENSDPITMYLEDIMTVAANIVGVPAVSVPAGFVDGLPVGLQIMAPQGKDTDVLALGAAYQAKTEWHNLTNKGPKL